MNFSEKINLLNGGQIPSNSVALVFSPNCGHCTRFVSQFNEVPNALSAGGLSNVKVVAVNVNDHFQALRAGGINVVGVPHIVIKTPSGIFVDYTGPREATHIAQQMAAEIARETATVLSGGAQVAPEVSAPADALLGGAVAQEVAPLEGGKRRRARKSRSRSRRSRRHMRGGATELAAGELEGGKRRKSRKSRSRRSRRHMRGGEVEVELAAGEGELEAGKRRKSRKSRRKSRRSRMRGGEATLAAGEVVAPVAEAPAALAAGELEGGKRRRSRSRKSRRKSRRSRMRGGDLEAGELEGGKRRRSRSRKSRRKSRRSRVRGGDLEAGEVELEAGKRSRSRSRWQMAVKREYATGKYRTMTSASRAASKKYKA